MEEYEKIDKFVSTDTSPLGFQLAIERLLMLCAAKWGNCVSMGIVQEAHWQFQANVHINVATAARGYEPPKSEE